MKRYAFLILSFLFFATTFKSDRINTSGWYQQSFPNLNGSSIMSITFLDSLTGFAATNTNSSLQAYILKTTNGGDNWLINYTYSQSNTNWYFVKIGFVDSNTGYAFGWSEMFKTTNAGLNWNIIINDLYADDIALINNDTMLAALSNSFDGGVYRSTNGGYNWQLIWTNGTSGNPSKIYMFDKNMGFHNSGTDVRKTTNGGVNWIDFSFGGGYKGIQFLDTLIGWKTFAGILKTTNGGLNWMSQQVPPMNYTEYRGISILNKDSIWVCGPIKIINNKLLGAILKTTNGGANWGYQIVDTATAYSGFSFISFTDNKHGWAFPYYTGGGIYDKEVHTTIGGNEITYYTGIRHIPGNIPEKFSLGQNYPNPFNPVTNIPYELKEPSHVTLKVYDVQGKEVKELVNGRWGTGKFIADFDGSSLSSGIYFYKIIIHGEISNEIYSETERMIMVK